MTNTLFTKQRVTVYAPTIRYDGAADQILLRDKGVETDITSKRMAVDPSSLRWGWCAYAVGSGKVIKDLRPITEPMASQPIVSAGQTKKGQPAIWRPYACVDVIVAGVQAKCVFEMEDRVIYTVIEHLCQNAPDPKKLVIEYTGSEEATDPDGDKIRVPAFDVVL